MATNGFLGRFVMRLLLLVIGFGALMSSGCLFMGMAGAATPVTGVAFTEVKYPMAVTNLKGDTQKLKKGEAMCTSILGLVATGDASVEAARLNGGITKVHWVDVYVRNILGLYAEYKVVVWGE